MEAQGRRPARQRKHRLPREAYTGEIVVAFTACVARQISPFTDASLVDTFKCFLSRASHTHGCRVLGYCFMPDHVHVALQGTRPHRTFGRPCPSSNNSPATGLPVTGQRSDG